MNLPRIFVSVGTDIHPFHRLLSWVSDLARQEPELADWQVQYGHSPAPALPGSAFLSHDELCDALAAADLVICHGGPTTIAEARRRGRQPLVVARSAQWGEHVDGHQQRFVRRLAAANLIRAANEWPNFRQLVHDMLDEPVNASVDGRVEATAQAAHAFGDAVETLFGRSRPVALTGFLPIARAARDRSRQRTPHPEHR